MASRRTLRTAIFPSSANFLTSFTSSFRRSSLSGGIGTLRMLPSLTGFSPRLPFRTAFSIGPSMAFSHGWTLIEWASGVLMFATCFRGVMVP